MAALVLFDASHPPTHRSVATERLASSTFSTAVVNVLTSATTAFRSAYLPSPPSCPSPSLCSAARSLLRTLHYISLATSFSPNLCVEFAADGGHSPLSALLKLPPPPASSEDDGLDRTTLPLDPTYVYAFTADLVEDLHSLVYEIASSCTAHHASFPAPATPLDPATRVARQPRSFSLPLLPPFLIDQVSNVRQTGQDDVGFVMWPSAVVLALFVALKPALVRGKSVLELGAGCGLTGLVCGAAGAASVVATDFSPLVLANLDLNVRINELADRVSTELLDFYQQSGTSAAGWLSPGSDGPRPPAQVVVAADVICKDSDAGAAARSVFDCLAVGGEAFVVSGTGDHRFGVDLFSGCCKDLDLTIKSEVQTVQQILGLGEHGDVILGCLEQCAGFVDDMTFWFHHIEKRA